MAGAGRRLMPAIRIMNWNVQNYGPTKAGDDDVVSAIAKVVEDNAVDIFVMLEVNTTHAATATTVAKAMRDELFRRAPGVNDWDLCVLSPNTGLEFYAVFVRNAAVTVPLTIYGPLFFGAVPKTLGGTFHSPITTARFHHAGGHGVSAEWFPLMEPDIGLANKNGRVQGTAPGWDGRLPVLALFWLPGAAPANRLLPIVACHYAADHNKAEGQFNMMRAFSPLRALAPGVAHPNVPIPYQLQIHPPGGALGPHTPNYYVLLGDFNVDWLRNTGRYWRLTRAGGEGLGDTGWVTNNTHLVTLTSYTPRDYKTTDDLIVNSYDNFFTRGVAPANAAYRFRVNVPDLIRRRILKLQESVEHYAELDQRGFSGDEYQDLVNDFASQLTGDTSVNINLNGQLVGSRLISDHLPVVLDLTVA
jgi:hypothetical protein